MFKNSIPSILNANPNAFGAPPEAHTRLVGSIADGQAPSTHRAPGRAPGFQEQQDGYQPQLSRKRQKRESTRPAMSYPRRRAVTACQLCRVRKTKCSNERPTCSSCTALGADCQYEDRSDHSSFDPASLMILQKLNQIISRLDDGIKFTPDAVLSPQSTGSHGASIDNHARPVETRPEAIGLHEAVFNNHQTLQEDDTEQDASSFDYLKVPSSRATPDAILLWPIFEGHFHQDCLTETLFVPEGSDGQSSEEDATQKQEMKGRRQTRGMHDEDVPGLVNRFLAYVHTKNPILDVRTIREYARKVSEDGPQWDAPSCLILLACALGTIAKPFDFTQVPDISLEQATSTDLDSDARKTADIYYTMARKRFGLLGRSITTSQCYVLSGVYLMYTIRPLRAWNEFLQASINYHIYFKCQISNHARGHFFNTDIESQTRRLEQRLYWTCFKSECEIRAEMALPESGISDLRYPYMFPSPPSPGSPVAHERPDDMSLTTESPISSTSLSRSRSLDQSQQQSWFYYLTEITLRRIGNRIMNAYYQADHYSWANMVLPETVKVAEQFEEQLDECYHGLPESIAYDDRGSSPLDELQYLVKARALEIRAWLYKPFLYYAIHHANDAQTLALVQPWAEKAVVTGMEKLSLGSIRHRHHGTWYACRNSATAGLSIIAARKSGRVKMPANWDSAVRVSIDMLTYWERESADIEKARMIVQSLYNDVRDA